jgi:hypothetical protein
MNPRFNNIKFPLNTGAALERIWQITMSCPGEPDTLYCGVEPAALFKSTDGRGTLSLVQGLFNHPHRAEWGSAHGGMCLHTVAA